MRKRSDLVLPKFCKTSKISDIVVNIALLGFVGLLLYYPIKGVPDAFPYFISAGIIFGIWLISAISYKKNYPYLHMQYTCGPERLINRVYDEDRILPLNTGLFCTVFQGKFYVRYGYATKKLYLFSKSPIDYSIKSYIAMELLKNAKELGIWIIPENSETLNWIEDTFGCKEIAAYPRITYFPKR